MRFVFISTILAALLVGGCFTRGGRSYVRAGFDFDQLDMIAVVDVVGAVGGEEIKNQIADFFTMELLDKGYAPIERPQIISVLEEQNFKAESLTAEAEAVEIGRFLQLPTVLIVNVPNFGEEMRITAKLMKVRDSSVLWMGSSSGKTGRSLSKFSESSFGGVADIGIFGGGGRAGGIDVFDPMVGQALSPKEAKKIQGIVKKACKSLPSRFSRSRFSPFGWMKKLVQY